MRVEAPKRPYRNLEDFRLRYFIHLDKKTERNLNFWPCLNCKGGKVVAYQEYLDESVIRKCQVCEGSGQGYKSAVVELYSRVITSWKGEYSRFRSELKAWKQLKLTDTEIAAIKRFGYPKRRNAT